MMQDRNRQSQSENDPDELATNQIILRIKLSKALVNSPQTDNAAVKIGQLVMQLPP